jgi:hypothetical protein
MKKVVAVESSEAVVPPLFKRVTSSLVALAIVWVSAAVAVGIYVRSARGAVAGFISAIPVFAIAWIVAGLPAIAAGRRVIQIPMWIMGLLGAGAGLVILFGLDGEDRISSPLSSWMAGTGGRLRCRGHDDLSSAD